MSEAGIKGVDAGIWLGLFAPAGVPKDVVQRLNAALHQALANGPLTERLQADGTESMLMSPEEFSDFLKREVRLMNKLVLDLGIPKD